MYQPPWIFTGLWKAASVFIDPVTAAKVVMIYGDVSDGSANDVLLKTIIGDDWKERTGVESKKFNN